MKYDWSILIEKFPIFLPAAFETLKITAAAIIVGLVIGLLTSMCRISKIKLIYYPATFYVNLVRGTPILLQLFIVYYGLTDIVNLSAYPSAIIAFGLHNGAYISEIFRGAIKSIDRGQFEAARSIGMSKFRAMYRIILPQALKRAVPPLGNQFIIATKDSSLASAVTVKELLLKSQQMGSSTFRFMEYFLIAGIYYFIMTSILGFFVHKLEKRLAVSDR
ncbi:polar amino acid ABC transporter, inner membrane subunit [Ruminiclostridium papyrosolvens DSM 2782]|uniref:Polar amino acid ABC transporter, inner membrane subunit n=1 Tax=Ruminiclostridium papyrosolvens DSM 2782 TaxID=588581 RepID=F1TDA7_9FIRM|nr:amino acid ABC transporter permease [Ruminiclostridium papyrosolvens]EGD47545.1 polar amino acid ABC transporter, inner membrane subunit [Ruminiclostridium papyrosolvens DSM 2782]WES36508.1 amino acid ABC transporter permease [Ruminiclostridium papyrosolvens DSM 2782]